jgi:hypothetical protein
VRAGGPLGHGRSTRQSKAVPTGSRTRFTTSAGARYLLPAAFERALSFFAWRFSFSDLLAAVLELFEPPLSLFAMVPPRATIHHVVAPVNRQEPPAADGRTRYSVFMMTEFFLTELGKTLRIEESDEGALRIDILKDGAWTTAPRGMIGLRLSPSSRRLTAREVRALPI